VPAPAAFIAERADQQGQHLQPARRRVLDYRRRLTELGPRHYSETATLPAVRPRPRRQVPESSAVLSGWKYELSFNHGDSSSVASTTAS